MPVGDGLTRSKVLEPFPGIGLIDKTKLKVMEWLNQGVNPDDRSQVHSNQDFRAEQTGQGASSATEQNHRYFYRTSAL
jgi:hypothetical protein